MAGAAGPGEVGAPFIVRGKIVAVGPEAELAIKGPASIEGKATVSGTVVAENLPSAGGWSPTDHGLKAWTFDPNMVAGGSLLSAGVVKLDRINVRAPVVVRTAYFWTSVAGSSLTADQNFIGLYNSTGTLLVSVDADVPFAATAGLQTVALGTALALAEGFYWFAWLTNGGTAPTVARGTAVTGGTGVINLGLAAATFRSATNGTGQTALPASLTVGSNAANFANMWVALG